MENLSEHLLNRVEELTKQIKKNPTALDLAERAALLCLLDAKQEALADINKAIKLAPENGQFYYIRAAIFDKQEQGARAKQSLKKAIQLGFEPSDQDKDNFALLAIKYGLKKAAWPRIRSFYVSSRQKRKYGLPER